MAEDAPSFLVPSRVELAFGHVLAWLVRMGVVRGHFYVLEVRGRKTGKTFSLPVDLIEVEGQQYLVCARGNSNWVRNARAAGEIALVRAMRRRRHEVQEIPPEQRPVILKAYLDRYANEVQRFFPVPKGAAAEAFHDLAARYPVFALSPVDGKLGTATS
jgi:deazaflavin-dependent oxidoreductase (nitroreductase family)